MNILDFEEIIKKQLKTSEDLLVRKGTEYAGDTTEHPDLDRLSHFKKAAALLDISTNQAILSFMAKHIVSITTMVNSKEEYPIELWEEKISDAINYLLILRAAIEED